jgi:FkbM family methyltransferase
MRKVFIDGGAHCGCSRKKFRQVYDPNNEYDIYSFEPDPSFNQFCPDLINKALWDTDGFINFYKYRLSGASSLLKSRADRITSEKGQLIQVESIDLDKFIRYNFSVDDYIILKLDVEGAEYTILPHLLKSGTFSYIKKLYLEWHNHRVGVLDSVDKELEKQIRDLGIDVEIWDAMKSGHCIGQKR